jgi:uncharacterized BrkB/YihY/UPF0761 family membrane protein
MPPSMFFLLVVFIFAAPRVSKWASDAIIIGSFIAAIIGILIGKS